ncbi:MAG TPA: 30S ribosome-binding factor RbfA [Polyangia bacterium]|nr:30S ribosome-binding factor RbfA [Polyangia bacterium]
MSKRHRRPPRGGAISSNFDTGASAGHRHDRLEHLLLEELNGLLRGEVTDPRLVEVGFSRVELSVDYGMARVWFVAMRTGALERQDRQRIEAALERAMGFLRARLALALDLKRCPNLRFLYDPDASGHLGSSGPAVEKEAPNEAEHGPERWVGEEADGDAAGRGGEDVEGEP